MNGYVEEAANCWLWCLLFGPLYFAVKGIWTHAVISFFLATMTAGFSWIIYPFFATEVVRAGYLKKGWIEVGI